MVICLIENKACIGLLGLRSLSSDHLPKWFRLQSAKRLCTVVTGFMLLKRADSKQFQKRQHLYNSLSVESTFQLRLMNHASLLIAYRTSLQVHQVGTNFAISKVGGDAVKRK